MSVGNQAAASELAAALKPANSSAQAVTGWEHLPPQRTAERQTFVVVLRDAAALSTYIPAWQELADEAAEPNVFYEPWTLLPALAAFGAGKDLRFVLIFAADEAQGNKAPVLCGFFPLERQRSYKGLPVTIFRLWQHPHCYLCTPLLRAEYAEACLTALFDWLAHDSHGCPLLEFAWITGDGAFAQALHTQLQEQATLNHQQECFTRALFRPHESAAGYVQTALSGKRRRELKRLEKRLAELGRLEYHTLELTGDATAWTESFLLMENSGWKGRAASSLAADKASQRFFRTLTGAAFERGRLLAHTLCLDGQPIAQRCSLLAGPGSFAFKTAFDEAYARFSPGVLLELEVIYRLHTMPELRWMDSCAALDSALINRLWPERRLMQDIVVATGRQPGGLVVSALPLLKWVKHKLHNHKSTGGSSNELSSTGLSRD